MVLQNLRWDSNKTSLVLYDAFSVNKPWVSIDRDNPEKRVVSKELTDDYCNEIGAKYFETSSLDGTNVKELFEDIAKDFLDLKKEKVSYDKGCQANGVITLDSKYYKKKSKTKWCINF